MSTETESMSSKLNNPKISERTISKLKRIAEADAPSEHLFPDEAKEIIEEFHRLSILLLAERCGSIVISSLARPSVLSQVLPSK